MEITRYGPTVITRFWAKVAKRDVDQCWPWMAATTSQGYGLLRGKKHGPFRRALAHRLSYEIAHGADPGDLLVCHSCDNPRCVNPGHLFLGTVQDNTDDMMAKGRDRHPLGERHHLSKLTAPLVREARIRRAGGETIARIAAAIGVSKTAISDALVGRTWAHIAEPTAAIGAQRGERHHQSQLTELTVREIRAEAAGGASASELARRFGVRRQTIDAVVQRRTWRHVPG